MRRRSPLHLFTALLLAAALWAGAAAAQTPLYLVNDRTEVRAIEFKFSGSQTFEPALLEEQIALTDMGALVGFRRRFSFIPFVPPVGTHLFSPIEMQKDVVRLERFYNRNGFLFPEVDWLVRLDSAKNTVRLVYTVEEGPPLLLDGLVFVGSDDEPAIGLFPPALRDDWRGFRDEIALQQGTRLDDFTLLQLESRTLGWVRDQGYAFADVIAVSQVDSLRNRADVVIGVRPGPRGRVSEIQIEGAESVSSTVVRRELPFRVGDRFSASKLIEGQREVFGLNLFQIALADVPEEQPEDSTVVVRLRVREGDPRIITAQAGYLSEAGLTGQAQWTHRNFFGGARTFTASTLANTGFGSFVTQPSVLYRASVSLRQPYFLNRRLALLGSPFAEYRDDEFDKSTSFGGNATLLYELEQLKTASLQFGFESRDVQDYRFGTSDDTQTGFIESLQEDAVELGVINRNTLGLTATYGNVDNDLDPQLGYIFRPSVEVAGPPALSSVEYGRASLTATGFYPLTDRIGLLARVTGGRLFPFGQSLPDEGEAFSELLRLRSSLFLGGGTGDVRGWGNGLLGPKVLDLVEEQVIEDDVVVDTTYTAERYFALGGLTKLVGTVEARLPFPGLGPTWGTFAFFDIGSVSTQNERFDLSGSPGAFLLEDTYGDPERLFYAVGGGFSFATPVGALRFAVGYKLNPSFFDLRSPQDIADAIGKTIQDFGADVTREQLEAAVRDTPTNSFWGIPESNRIHLHLTIGQTF
ncbi:MAG: BamA/TamA family outer membrane protein [Rhodothermales bacterium]